MESNKKGITLPEYLIAFSIIGIISVMVAGIYFAHFRLFSNQNTAIDVSTQNKLGLTEITNQVRQSQSVAASCGACGADNSNATLLILQLWPIDNNGDPLDPGTTNYDYIVYKRNPTTTTNLIRITYPSGISSRKSATHVVATNISALAFTYNDPTPANATQVTIAITTTATVNGKTQTVTDMTKADLRNK